MTEDLIKQRCYRSSPYLHDNLLSTVEQLTGLWSSLAILLEHTALDTSSSAHPNVSLKYVENFFIQYVENLISSLESILTVTVIVPCMSFI